ncbi:MAG: DUF1634 domain-containing protein [Chitinophagaceae bacterium]|nr:DUF1634 domain-containing protein [Oligoflexus sp.]
MTPLESHENDKDKELIRLELAISIFLRWGVFVSGTLLAIGWVGLWLKSGDVLENFRVYRPEHLSVTIDTAWRAHDYAMLSSILGLAVLVALPISRVLLTAYLFIKQKDHYLAAMALFVFFALLGSFFLGIEI